MKLYHVSYQLFSKPCLEKSDSNRRNHANGALGFWVAKSPDWLNGFGKYLYEISFSPRKIYDLKITELCKWTQEPEQFYKDLRENLIRNHFDYISIIEANGSSDMGVVLNMENISILSTKRL